jgi:hypothetical protein
VPWRISHGAGADEDGIGESAEESHQKPICLVAAADHRPGGRHPFDGDDAVDRLDEVCVQRGVTETKPGAVEPRQLAGELVAALVVEEDF